MKPWLLAAATTLLPLLAPMVAFAQGEGEAAPENPPPVAQPDPNAQTGAVVEAPANKGSWIKLDPEVDREHVVQLASEFFAAVIVGDARPLAELSALPFHLEDRKLNSEDEFIQSWQKALRSRNTDMLTLYGFEIFSAAEMEKKYGKPPARLANFPWKKPATYLVLANLSGRAAIAVVQKTAGGFAVIAYHD